MPLTSTCIDHFKNTKILVIGDVMLDKFKYGKVERISPEAPVPVFKFEHEKQMLGGAGNVVANLVSLGCQTTFIGIIGKDDNGLKIRELLDQIGARSHLIKLKNYRTIVTTRLIARNNHLLRADQEEIFPVNEDVLPKYQKILEQIVKKYDIILVSDYNKGLLTPVTTRMIVDICRKYHKNVIVDPKGNDYAKYAGSYLVKPNLKEFSEATGRKYDPKSPDFKEQVIQGARLLFDKFTIQNLVITLSEHGMMFIPSQPDHQPVQIPTQAKEVFDVSGAGDTSLAALGASLAAGLPILEAINMANIASGIVVGKLGTATVSPDELSEALTEQENTTDIWRQKRKIITLKQAKTIVEKLRAKGLKIGFTNGCFDCCHLGHLNSFMQAKQLCDVLIVAVNSDASVKRYKGPNRPIQDEQTRSILLASLEFIDYVILFEEDSPIDIVRTLKPDIVAKEGYTLDQWPEGRLAISYGGEAVTLNRLEGYSTSDLVHKMKG